LNEIFSKSEHKEIKSIRKNQKNDKKIKKTYRKIKVDKMKNDFTI
jgi:hypothetical protein